MTTSRRQAREWVVQMLCAADLNPPDDIRGFVDAHWQQFPTLEDKEGGAGKARGKLKDFAEERVFGVLGSTDDIDGVLVPLLENWDLYRLGTVERAVLRLGLWEMMHSDVPKPVVINEAVDIVNWFSSPKSRTLVNGVLDRYAKSLG